jgi:GABA(A) receptor-associated protein
MNNFKNRISFRERKNHCDNILLKYPDRIPILCEKFYYSKNAPEIDKHKYLAGYDLTVGQFMLVIRKRMNLKKEIGLYMFINGIIPSNSSLLRNLYSDFKDADGFLYITYDVENTFGNN